MAENTLATTTPEESKVPATREESRYQIPPVDIYETDEGLVVVADLPGADGKDVDVRVENDILTIQAKAKTANVGDSLHREFELTGYFRQFQLSEVVDQEKISAECKHGVLTVHLPRHAASKPKQITVNVG